MTRGSARRYPPAHGRLGPTETAPPITSTGVLDEEHDIDEQLLADLVRDWAIACEYRISADGDTCGARATYWLICRHCEHAYAECTHHRVTEAAAWALAPHEITLCRRCGHGGLQGHWRDFALVIPIGARP